MKRCPRPAPKWGAWLGQTLGVNCGKGLLLVLFFVSSWVARAADPKTEMGDASRGREIYRSGRNSAGNELVCVTGEQGFEVSAAVMKCANCHGADGRGRPEGGAFPSDIRWSELAKPYPVALLSGRRRKPYSESLLARAMTQGIDSSGTPLGWVMPRYRLTPGEAADLIAYLKQLDTLGETGVTDDRITIGIMLPPKGAGRAAGAAVRETVEAAFEEVNRAGGIYGRQLRGCFATAPEQGLLDAWEKFLGEEKPFAVLDSYLAGAEADVAALLERKQVPLFQPLADSESGAVPFGRYLFELTAGWEMQSAVLAQFAAETGRWTGATALICYEASRESHFAVQRIQAIARGRGWTPAREIEIASVEDWPQLLRSSEAAPIFWLGKGEPLEKLFSAAKETGSYPVVLAPALRVGSQIGKAPEGFGGNLFLAVANLPEDADAGSRAQFFRLAESARFTKGELATRLTALGAVRLLSHLLGEAGRELTREKIVTLAEHLYEFQPGYTRPVTFTRTRRAGASGAHVASLDLLRGGLRLPARWVETPASGGLPDAISLPAARSTPLLGRTDDAEPAAAGR